MSEIARFSHDELLDLLRLCPASVCFGMRRVDLTKGADTLYKARRLAYEMVTVFQAQNLESIDEAPSSQERSSISAKSNKIRKKF